MPGQARLGDKAKAIDGHNCVSCVHTVIGPAVKGSEDVIVNGKFAIRTGDTGIHAECCGPNLWYAGPGSKTVFINGRSAFRDKDQTIHCGGIGNLIEGSGNVIVGDSQSTVFKKAAQSHAPFVCNCNK